MLESELVDQIRESFAARGIWSLKVHGSIWQPKGTPDILGIIPPGGQGFAIEVKVPGHESKTRCEAGTCATDIQMYRLEEIGLAGGLVGIAHSVQEANEILQGGGRYAARSS